MTGAPDLSAGVDGGVFGDMLLAVVSGFLLAAFAPLIARAFAGLAGWLLALLPIALLAYFITFIGPVSGGAAIAESLAWLPQLGIDLSFRLDGLSLVFALLITGIGALILIYAGAYLADHPQRGRFFSFLLMFMASMLGLVLADNVIAFFVFWELTSLTSFLLIGFDHERPASRRAAVQALVVTGGGGLVLMAGLILMALTTGAWDLSGLNAAGDLLRGHALYGIMLALVLAGAFTKSAQVPFHFWLPNAMEAPTPVSAYLHSATMVKAGVYLLMRLTPALGGTSAWMMTLTLFGGATLLVGAALSLRQTDMKLILAYTTVASLGLLVMLTGLGSDIAIEAAVLYLIAHAFFKGALFMLSGAVDHGSGTRDVTRLSGLRGPMPVTFAIAVLAALSMAGLPPLAGFLAKETIYGATGLGVAALVAILGNAMMVTAALAVAWGPFRGPASSAAQHAHEASLGLLLGPGLLAVGALVAGLLAAQFGTSFAGPMVSAILGRPVLLELSLWHGVNAALMMSLVTIALGLGLYVILPRLRQAIAAFLERLGLGADRAYDLAMEGLVALSRAMLAIIQPGQLRHYMLGTFAVLALALWVPIVLHGLPLAGPFVPGMLLDDFPATGMMILGVVGAVMVLMATTRLNAIVALGIQGVAVALLFLFFAAPDLAFTQFMVEILSVVILALVMSRLKLDAIDRRNLPERLVHGAVAVAIALGIGVTLMSLTQQPLDLSLTDFFAANSVPLAHGHNIVNVILVDFRGLDTLGEITVVLMTGLAAIALIRSRRRQAKGKPARAAG
ncbi:multicomponent Na+:H+ antiporter subunit A [Rhodoligotrophos appendicifer]|uniref:putative monovalent cation/H+ antiporter subunit A n=1 Tax=Rhodoligotrophos appendicifer TaxID=987056 RepID=UPI001FE35FBA|nr:putative monovalent cation/H+ antiporter subunit A [Rhodoligotrophos appendicifer]